MTSIDIKIAMSGPDMPSKEAGTTIARIVLSGLAETSNEAEGLKRKAVGGKECAWSIFSNG